MEIQGLDIMDYVDVMNVYTPLEYSTKLNKILFYKAYKKANIFCIHEARTVVKAKLWHGFLAQAISDINAMSRSIKRICTIIISQFIRDITADTRYTLNLYCKISRPLGKPARLYINVMWKDDRDLEKPKLRKRKLSGYLIYPNGKYQRFIPKYFEMKKPSKAIIELFEKADKEGKTKIIRRKQDEVLKELKNDLGNYM